MVNVFKTSTSAQFIKKKRENKIFTFKGIKLFIHDQQIIMNISRRQVVLSADPKLFHRPSGQTYC